MNDKLEQYFYLKYKQNTIDNLYKSIDPKLYGQKSCKSTSYKSLNINFSLCK